jgi:hypothetical protein
VRVPDSLNIEAFTLIVNNKLNLAGCSDLPLPSFT